MNKDITKSNSHPGRLNYFSVFAILYMTSFMCEMTENWKHPGFTWFFVFLITALVFTQITRLKFLLFLLSTTAYVLIFRFPEVANHVNFILFLNLSLIVCIFYSWQQPNSTDEDYLQIMLPFLRFSLVLVYFLAGFHKFNQDFFNPNVSCAGGLLVTGFIPMLTSKVLGIPSILFLAGSLAILIGKLWGNSLRSLPRQVQFFLLTLLTLIAVILGSVFLKMQGQFPVGFKAAIVISLAIVVILWELVGGLLLIVPRFQGLILLFSWVMHASLALIGFVDFGTLAFALLFVFIPPNYLNLLFDNPHVKLGKYNIHRVYGYFLILLLGSFLSLIHYRLNIDLGDMNLLNGLLLDFAEVIFILPILQNLCSANRLPWTGVPLWTKDTPKFTSILILLVFLYAMTPYLGLRTAGNFSMFSNLRTEGETSNHLLLASNPLKIWGYQEDVVEVLEIDDEAAKVGHKYRPLKGYKLPVIEFKKLIYKWTKANYTVPMTFIYDDVTYSSQDIVNDPTWRTPKRNWEMYLMDFRIIQPEGPNQCRW
ncbi:MAG: hypothetical protein RH949_16880 [Coleofasciculus sp. A1-SPW-01]